MAKRPVDRIAERIARQARRRMMRDLGATEAQLDEAYRRAADRIRERLRDVSFRSMSADQLRALTRDILDEAREEAESAITGSVRSATERASETSRAEAAATLGAAEAQVATAVMLTARERLRVAAEQIRGEATVDAVSLSRRLRRNHAAIEREMAGTITRSIRAGESVTMRAERLLDIDDLQAEIGQHVVDLADAARDARVFSGPSRYEQVVSAYRSRINRLGSSASANHSMRAATEQLVNDLRRAAPKEIDGIVERFVIEKARYQARVIARTETIAAYRRSFLREQETKPHAVGIRWTLSASHPRPDVCDLLANQDLYGLGPGGYPKDATPEHPHPLCTCVLSSIIDRKFLRRELARERGEEEPPRDWESGEHVTGAEWLARQPEAVQRRLLGPTRFAAFQRSPDRVITPEGHPRPVHEVLGRAPTRRAPAEVRAARPAVRRDRAEGQVRAFSAI